MSVARELAVSVDAFVTSSPLSVFRVRSFELPLAMVPASTKLILVASNAMLSILSTPVSAPSVSTFNPVDTREKSPVALPRVRLLPARDASVVSFQEVSVVNSAVPGAEVPMDARFAAPVADIFQLASVSDTSAPLLPRVKLPV